jgi:hypothetical protein
MRAGTRSVSLEKSADVVLAASSHHDEVNGKRHVDGATTVDAHAHEAASGTRAASNCPRRSGSTWPSLVRRRGSRTGREPDGRRLVVEEDDHTSRHGATHANRLTRPRRSPAGSGWPERRGGLPTVYRAAAATQVRCGAAQVTMCAGQSMRRLCCVAATRSRMTTAAPGGRWGAGEPGRTKVVLRNGQRRRPRTCASAFRPHPSSCPRTFSSARMTSRCRARVHPT